jgi:hypothetical protein
LHAANLVLVAPSPDVFFWVVGVIGSGYSLGAAVFRLFGDTDINSAAGGAIGIVCVEKPDALVCSRKNDTGELLFFQPFLGEWQMAKPVRMPVP